MTNSTLNYYQNNAKQIIEHYENVNMSKLHDKLKMAFSISSKLLEIGCGSGRDASALHKSGYEIFITDASDSMLSEAIKNHPEFKEKSLNLKLPDPIQFQDESFGGIYAIAVLMHLNEAEINQSFNEFNRVLRSKGRLFFSICIE